MTPFARWQSRDIAAHTYGPERIMSLAATPEGLGHAIAAAIMRTGQDPSKTADAVVAEVQKMMRGKET